MAKDKKNTKHDVKYLYARYVKFYNKADMEKADLYSNLAFKLHGVDLASRYYTKREAMDKKRNIFGMRKMKNIKYG